MQVSVVLRSKGDRVVTVRPDHTVADVAAVLAEHKIGAVVVSGDGHHIEGVLSERDIVRALADRGADTLAAPASSIMTTEVHTCQPDTTIETLMSTMTNHRIRHVPVVIDGQLTGVISIGDVVKDRIAALENETEALQSYISNPY